MRDGYFRGTTLIDPHMRTHSFFVNADITARTTTSAGSPGRLGSELRPLLSPGGSQSAALTVPVRASRRTFLRHCLSKDDYTTENRIPKNSVTEKDNTRQPDTSVTGCFFVYGYGPQHYAAILIIFLRIGGKSAAGKGLAGRKQLQRMVPGPRAL